MDYSKYFDFKLNAQQIEVANAIENFINSKKQVFILKGSAGTGKTSLVKGFCSYFTDINIKPILLATTGRAAKLLKDKTDIETSTIHSKIFTMKQITIDEKGEIVNELNNTNSKNTQTELRFVLKQNQNTENTIFLIDEASMISNRNTTNDNELKFGSGRLLNDIFKYIWNNKIIFIGDQAQLPPIKTSFSVALDANYIKSEFNIDSTTYTLTKVERQTKNSGIINNAIAIRDSISSKKYSTLKINDYNYDDIIKLDNDYKVILKYIEQLKISGQEKNIYISLSNLAVNQVNFIVRNSLYPNKNELFYANEKIMVANNNYKFDLLNGDIIEFIRFTGHTEYNKKAELTFVEIEFMHNDTIYTGLAIKEFLTSQKPILTSKQTKELLIDFAIRVKTKHNIKSTSDPLFIDYFRDDPYINALKLRYAYAITCHKAQGGEWENVFLYLEPYLLKLPDEERFRWVYTALTRASKKIFYFQN